MKTFKPGNMDTIFMSSFILMGFAFEANAWRPWSYMLVFAAGAAFWRHLAWLLFDRGHGELHKEREVVLRLCVGLVGSVIAGILLWHTITNGGTR